ncbi:MAG: phosphoethanolamine N-methyltransferase-like isoform [Rhodospirillales bacterium]|nr:phosphoethanolamine N-methyltransferase-like isoform [Rhodospirillales bacterium]
MTTNPAADDSQPLEEANRYSRRSILRSERMYGYGFQSPGYFTLMETFSARLPDLKGKRVLDIGSGLGGPAFYLNEHFGAEVVGLDNAADMTAISQERAAAKGASGISFVCDDIRTMPMTPNSFDVVWSRDCILYIPEKDKVWKQVAAGLKPGGWLFVTDFCRKAEAISPEFDLYLRQCRYYLRDIATYASEIAAHGLEVTAEEDITPWLVDYLIKEKTALEKDRAAFLDEYDEDDYAYLVNRWEKKKKFCESGDFRWGLFLARKR